MDKPIVVIPLPIQRPIGLGDAVKEMLDRLGIKFDSCNCDQRKKILNDWLQFSASKGK
jgi:hypothetical protein